MNFKKKTLSNGLRIITVDVPQSPSVSVMVLAETGSDYERQEENGLSHFLEHMMFKGTKKRPNSRKILHELDAIGASSNAFTSRECTGYWAKAHPKKFDQILDIISDIYLNSTLDEAEIRKEKGVVLEEINMYNDNPRSLVSRDFISLLYGDQPAGRDILGIPGNIRRFRQKDFAGYRAKHYLASSTIVVVAGNINPKIATEKIKKAFKDIPVGVKKDRTKFRKSALGVRTHVRKKKSDQIHLILGFNALPPGTKDYYAQAVLATILGKGMSSRLFLKVREDLGAAYYIGAGLSTFSNRSHLAIRAGLSKKKFDLVLSEITKEASALKNELVLSEELDKAKEYIIGKMFLSLETADSISDFYAEQEVLKLKIKSPQEEADSIRRVTAQDIRRIARKIFNKNNVNLAIVGDVKVSKNFGEDLVL